MKEKLFLYTLFIFGELEPHVLTEEDHIEQQRNGLDNNESFLGEIEIKQGGINNAK